MVALLFLFDIGAAARHMAVVSLAVIAALLGAGLLVVAKQVKLVSRTVAWLERHGRGPSALVRRLEKLGTLEDLVLGFLGRHPRRAAAVLLIEVLFHVLGVVEMWYTLALLAGAARRPSSARSSSSP